MKINSKEDFYELMTQLYHDTLTWFVTEFPKILIITLVFFILFKVIKSVIKGFSRLLQRRHFRKEGIDQEERNKRINTLSGIISTILKVVLVFFYIVIILEKMGVAVGPILASAGIVGLAVGFGAQELVRDMISGFFILLEDQIRIGDAVKLNGVFGEVESIELRTIELRDPSGVVHVFQNGKIDSLQNMSKEWSALLLDIGVAYKEDFDHVAEVMQRVGDEMYQDEEFKKVMIARFEILGLDKFGDSALVIRSRIKTKPGKQWDAAREYRKRLKKAFDLEKIEIPFPHTTVYWGEEINPLRLKIDENKKEAI